MTKVLNEDQTEPKLDHVSPDLLDFDQDNPRFAGQMAGKQQEEIQKLIFREPYYASELVDSLLENGFIEYEPLVVKRHNGRYLVIEGNRRLAAIREIRGHPEAYPYQKSALESIPVLIFPDKSDEQQQNDMRVYLGIRHLLGFREWPPISKAQFLERESQSPGGLDRVLKETRVTKAQARRFLIPYRLLHRAHMQLPKGEDFWVLGEALQRSGVKRFLALEIDPKTLEIRSYSKKNFTLLLDYLYGPRKGDQRDASAKVVYDTRDLSRLAKVLDSEKATTVLHAGKSIEEAEIYVDSREQSLARLSKVTRDLGVLLKKLFPSRVPREVQLLRIYKTFESAVKAFIHKMS